MGRRFERPLSRDVPFDVACGLVADAGCPALVLDGRGFDDGWGPTVAWRPVAIRGALASDFRDLERRLSRRRAEGGTGATGIALLLPYAFPVAGRGWGPAARGETSAIRIEVDAAVTLEGDRAFAVARDRALGEALVRVLAAGDGGRAGEPDGAHEGRGEGRCRTSLPREAYLAAVETVRSHIRRGDIYQANLTQRFERRWNGDAAGLFARLRRTSPAPRAALVTWEDGAILSLSPEVFVRVDPAGTIETFPIKGTRRREPRRAADDRAARELAASGKDRAELVMIVDLERNDLGRVCETGSIEVVDLCALRSYPEVHHLVARVRGRLRADVDPGAMLDALFPGGSITGAPKRRAIEILDGIEPVSRGFFTGSLFWFGDDGSVDSSILIRTVELREGWARIGAGGGIVADSVPDSEWRESNAKARALTRAFGFEPEEAR